MINNFTIRVTSWHLTFKCACYTNYDIGISWNSGWLSSTDEDTYFHSSFWSSCVREWLFVVKKWRQTKEQASEGSHFGLWFARSPPIDTGLHYKTKSIKKNLLHFNVLHRITSSFFFLESWSRCLAVSALQSAASVSGCCKFGMDVKFWAYEAEK